MHERWIADRMRRIEASGIRRMFELAHQLKDPINLSIGQPHFEVPEPIRRAAKAAIDGRHNGYTQTQGIPALRQRIHDDVAARLGQTDREVLITSGTSGALVLALCACVNPGDEVILFDPYFVSYPHLVTLAGGTSVYVDTYPDFQIDVNRAAAAITPRTKAILFSSPSNPTGACLKPETLHSLSSLARDRDVLLIADEIYRAFSYDDPFRSAAEWDPNVLVVDGFGKTYGMTGWRLGYAHGPRPIIQEMAKLQQFTFVCAPSIAQHAGLAALEFDSAPIVSQYRGKRDRLCTALAGKYEFARPGGAFYLYPRAPWGTGTEFAMEAIRHNLLVIPSSAFSRLDTHFRISYAVEDAILERGIEALERLADR